MRVLCTQGDSADLGERATLKLTLCIFSDGKNNTVVITVLFPWFASLGKGVSDDSVETYAALCIVASTIVMTILMKSWLLL